MDYIESLKVSDPLSQPIARSAIASLRLPPGSRGLDAGCGVGLQTLLLAEAVTRSGHVTGLDLSHEFLSHGRALVEESGLSEAISFQQGDVRSLPFRSDVFDWAWSANCVGYAPLSPLPLMRELARVVRPGGKVAILAWSSEQLLPGYPLLEARLKATTSGMAPFVEGQDPQSHFLRALGWFREAGLVECTTRTFAADAHAPLRDDIRKALVALLEMRWVEVESELTEEDRAEYLRLCRPKSPDFILNLPDYYAFFTYSLFCGTVSA